MLCDNTMECIWFRKTKTSQKIRQSLLIFSLQMPKWDEFGGLKEA